MSIEPHAPTASERRQATAAGLYRRLLGRRRPYVGVTGSVAKTTTVKLAGLVLAGLGRGYASSLGGNAGPHIPRAILKVRPWHRYCVLEISGHYPGALDGPLAAYRPTIGVVTWIGMDHWKSFGDPARIADEKAKMVALLPADGRAVLNADDPAVAAMAASTRAPVTTFGLAPGADVRGDDVRCAWPEPLAMTVRHGDRALPLRTELIGEHMAYPVLAAVAIGLACGLAFDECVRRLDGARGHRLRLSAHEVPGGATVLLDSRKAAASAVEAALRVLEQASAKRKIAVIGTLSDNRGSSGRHYRRVARRALEFCDRVYFVGPNAERVRKDVPAAGGRLQMFASPLHLHEHLEGRLGPGDLVLVKSSLGDHLDRLVDARQGPHACWKDRCGVKKACVECKHRLVPSRPEDGREPVED